MCFPSADVEIERVLSVIGCGRRSRIGVRNARGKYQGHYEHCGEHWSREALSCALYRSCAHGCARVRSAMKAGAQVVPPSAEYASS